MRVLFVHLGCETFVVKDLAILQSVHEVRSIHFRGLADLPPLSRGVRWSDVTFSWFGTIHALFAVVLSKMLAKKSVVVSGGYDVAKTSLLPHYGPLSKPYKRWGVHFVFANADLVLSVSAFNRRETIENAHARASKVRLVYHGFDPREWQRQHGVPKEDVVLTVGTISKETLDLKGLRLFAESARLMPGVPFVLVGPWRDGAVDLLKAIAPVNVTFTGPLNSAELLRMCSRAKVYVQASIRESFGCALAEAMLCECVPVVSRLGALPEVVGDCGFYVDDLDPETVATKIREAAGSDLGGRARDRIRDLYPLGRRQAEILDALDHLNAQ